MLEDLKKTLAMAFKQVALFTVPLEIKPNLTYFILSADCDNYGMVIPQWQPLVKSALNPSQEPLAEIKCVPMDCAAVVLLAPMPDLELLQVLSEPPCPPVANTQAVPITQMTLQVEGACLSPLEDVHTKSWAVVQPAVTSWAWEVPKVSAPKVLQRLFGRIRALVRPVPARFDQLPLLRRPLPLHRFGARQKIRFQQALAQKAQRPVDHIRLLWVYDRVIPALYQSIVVDAQGGLWCHPSERYLVRLENRSRRQQSASEWVNSSDSEPGSAFALGYWVAGTLVGELAMQSTVVQAWVPHSAEQQTAAASAIAPAPVSEDLPQ
ncbi:MAG: hypothetical protein SFZ03_10875 [Candidatus Melainabacteria bacterium]|nr:hypothetical protein [Candidatus Melainabacteria bacterium]